MDLSAVVRISTAKQADAYGPEAQRTDIKVFARQGGHRIAPDHWYQDTAGSDIDDLEYRDGLRQALLDVKEHRTQGIIFGRLDRLSRDVVLQETVLRDVLSWGGVLLSTSAAENEMLSNDADDPSREMIRVILSAVNRYEKKMIRLRMRNGRITKASRGGYAYGAPHFGVRAEDHELVPDDSEQATLTRMRELAGAGNSLRQICAALDSEGLPPKRGGRWHPVTVQRALAR